MPRKQRVHFAGAIYHVIARGNNRENIFKKEEDKREYADLLAKYKDRLGFDLLAYVLMDNHFHLLIQVDQSPLMKIMQGLQQTYTQYFNRKYHHVGHVFQQRYKAFLCGNDAYLITLICYIHQNPCRANIDEGLDYTWSSHRDYIKGWGSLVNPQLVLKLLNEDTEKAIQLYKETFAKVQEYPIPSAQLIEKNSSTEKSFSLEENKSGENENKFDQALLTTKMSLEDLVTQILNETDVSRGLLLGSCRIRSVAAARNQLIYRAVKFGVCTRTELSRFLQLDPARITRIYQETDSAFSRQ